MAVACCASCGHTTDGPGWAHSFGRPSGHCPSCGRMMFWMTYGDGLALRGEGTRRAPGWGEARGRGVTVSGSEPPTRDDRPPS
jgi:hypothetical protein